MEKLRKEKEAYLKMSAEKVEINRNEIEKAEELQLIREKLSWKNLRNEKKFILKECL